MWTRSLLKQKAWEKLKGYYWMALVVSIACYFLSGLAGGILSGGVQFFTFFAKGTDYLETLDMDIDNFVQFLSIFGMLYAVMFVVAFVNVFFVVNPLKCGLCHYYVSARNGSSKFEHLFYSFTNGRYMKIVKAMFFWYIEIYLWSLLFIVPGIIKWYEYALVPYLLAENPDMDIKRAKQISQTTMDGEKMDFFVLQLSFIGWFCLGLMLCGYGLYAVMPYYQATEAEFYTCMRAKMLSYGYTTEAELSGGSDGFPNGAAFTGSSYNDPDFTSNAYHVPNAGFQNPPQNPNDQYGGVMPSIDDIPNPSDPSGNDPDHPYYQ